MHPEVDNLRTPPLRRCKPTDGIFTACPVARTLLKEKAMRITTMVLVCSSIAACMPGGELRHNGTNEPDAAVTSTPACTSPTSVSGDLSISGDFSSVPTTCWTLSGKLTLTGSAVSSLAKLGPLQSVGALEIGNTMLTKIDAAQAIAVAGDVSIHDNEALADVSSLAPATTLNDVTVENNAALADLAKLSTVTLITGAVSIQNNAKLATIDLSQVTRIEGAFTIASNTAATTVNLAALQSVGPLTIKNNGALTSLGSFAALQFVHGDLVIDSNPVLAKLSDAMTSTIQAVDASITITNNPKLADLGELSHAGLALSINITDNAQLGYCYAREVGCCVYHQGTAQTHNDLNQNCSSHSWCYDQNGGCYAYTNN